MAMSDAQWPPQIGEQIGDRKCDPPADAVGDADIIPAAPYPGVGAHPPKEEPASSPEAAVNEQAQASPPDAPEAGASPDDAQVATAAPIALQPLPDVPPSDARLPAFPPLPLVADPIAPDLIDAPAAPSLIVGSTPFDLEPPAQRTDESGSGQQPLQDADEPRAADIQLEVSPIFSALDAAERAAEAAAREAPPAPAPDAFASSILLPYTLAVDGEQPPPAPAAAPPRLEPLSPAPPKIGGEPAAEAGVPAPPIAAVPETPQEAGATPRADAPTAHPEALQDAAARIAAEASATEAALENLKRLLVHKMPEPGLITSPTQPRGRPERADPPPVPAYRPPAHRPIAPPPMMAAPQAAGAPSYAVEESALPRRSPVAAVGSFLAGFALSWVLGAVLYVFLTTL
ncbi:MAG: hypothetical protein K2X43_15575 [Hyphomonadaceae bacterium]|nr:hypothetical protein [Hyphomonadaceae bacterium]